MADTDPKEDWLGYTRPVGLVVAPLVLRNLGLVPEPQTRVDSEAVRALLTKREDGPTSADREDGPALADPWAFFANILGWRTARVAGAPGGPAVPDALSVRIEESDTELRPDWAVAAVRDDTAPADAGPAADWQILVRIEAAGVLPDARGVLEGWEATPHQRLERLCRDTGIPVGLLLTDTELRLIHAPRGETSGWLHFPWRSLAEVGGRPMLAGLKLLLSDYRLHKDARERRLPALLQASRDAQAEVSTRLAAQVLGALHSLMRGLTEADPARMGRLARTAPGHVYDGLLAVLLRLVFLLYAEDRDLIPSSADPALRALYDQGYGVRPLHARLIEDRAHHELTLHLRRGAWGRLLALFRLVHGGDPSGAWIRGRGGRLFDPAAYPFLEGRDGPADAPAPAEVSDGTILDILDRLLVLDGEKLSYRALDVEQIGSVYETVMGFTVETMAGPALAIKAGKHDRTPVFVDLAALLATKPAERAKYLKEKADRSKLPGKAVDPALKAARDIPALQAALTPIVDERASPGAQLAPPGTPLLQPTDERRRTGSHYTPRALTGPIVRHTLEPVFRRLGERARPEDVLALKVCDPAMGSGAFLVEACRVLGDGLVAAWARHPETRPAIPPDEDEPLHARRLVAQRCLYGVDRNPRAVELAKLSLWLATLARDHEFTFLDHALKCGDSLVGLGLAEIEALNWDSRHAQFSFVGSAIKAHLNEAEAARADLRARAEWAATADLLPLFRSSEGKLAIARLIGDGVIAAFFAADKAKARAAELATLESRVVEHLGKADWMQAIAPLTARLKEGAHPLTPFHWPVEFPEVFRAAEPGFDAIVGNPPFAGKNTISAGNREHYLPWLQTLHPGAHGNSDLVAHFFRRAFGLLREGGVFGLIATKTIGQGDTRETGLATLLEAGGSILRATRRLKWPGEAAVVVSVVHMVKGPLDAVPVLDERPVRRISAYLVEGDLDRSLARLKENAKKAFVGSYVLGMGFTFDDVAAAKGEAESLDTMRALIAKDPRNAERIFPFIGGDEVTNSPTHAHHRYVMQFEDIDCHELKRTYPSLFSILYNRVKPERDKLKDNSDGRHRKKYWWKWGRYTPALYNSIKIYNNIIVNASKATPHHAFALVSANMLFSQNLNIFALCSVSALCLMQSRIHEVWSRFLGTTFKDDLTYTKEDCFETFPFPLGFETDPALEAAGRAYHDHRAALMVARNEGMTKTYNRFHNPAETGPDIVRLRELHAEMDRAVLRAYGWSDLADAARPEFLTEADEDDHTYQGRYFWPAPMRDAVLARLLALNAERAAAGGAAVGPDEDDAEDDAP